MSSGAICLWSICNHFFNILIKMETMKHLILYFILTLFIAALTGCDEIDEPYGNQIEIEEATELTRKAVIFEFTGIHCTNCPDGHVAIENIDSVYHGHVIPISVHAGFFAQPHGSEEPDFRTAFGNQLYESLEEPSTPAVIFASMNVDDAIVGATASWQGEVGYFVPQYTKYIIEPTVSLAENAISVNYEITERDAVASELRFYTFIIEDHIEGPQTGYDINPYDHRHVLRKCISNLNGNTVNFTNGNANLSFTTEVDENWNLNNVYVVGIIVDGSTTEIYTGEQRKLIE